MRNPLHESVTRLRRTPGILRAMLSGIEEEFSRHDYGERTLSPFDVVGHLIHGERTDWMPRAHTILEQGEAQPFEPFDRCAQTKASKGCALEELTETFAELRTRNISDMEGSNITPEQLTLRGTHPDLGSVTLGELIATGTVHDLGRIAQIARAPAHQFGDATGPWREFLSILK